jgi:UDP-N-acetylglucosamine transferase subunit ALG13
LIFVTVGTQLPFERLIQAVDAWAESSLAEDVFVQLGETRYRPRHCRYAKFVEPQEWEACFQQASRIISHAGMGTILKALDYAKPLIVMPRIAALGEHRNDHQLATAARFRHAAGIRVVENESELSTSLGEPLPTSCLSPGNDEGLARLIKEIRDFVDGPA